MQTFRIAAEAGAGTAVQAADDHDRPVRLGERQCRASSCG